VVHARGEDDEVTLDDVDPQPSVALVTHVKVAAAVKDETDLLVVVDVLGEKDGKLRIVLIAEARPRARDLVAAYGMDGKMK
jgi:hypothetical protein